MLKAIREEPPEAEPAPSSADKLRAVLRGPLDVKSLPLTGLLVLATLYTLYLARAFFLPIVLSLLLSLLLRPVVRWLKRLHVPEGLSAAVVVLGLLAALGLGVYELANPAYDWIKEAPRNLRRVENKLRGLKKPVQAMNKATEQVEKITKVTEGGPAQVAVTRESLGQKVFSRTTGLVFNGVVTFILLYFLLASGTALRRKVIRALPTLADRKRAVEIARRVESEVSAYLVTITLINLALGGAVAGALSLLGVPNPLLWGVVAVFANYVPYLGPIAMTAVLAMVGFLNFEGLGQALLVPGVYVALHLPESYLVSPLVLGRRLTLNPLFIFLGLTFWGWLWGITGAVLAVPIMVVLKIFCDHSEPLAPLGELLGN